MASIACERWFLAHSVSACYVVNLMRAVAPVHLTFAPRQDGRKTPIFLPSQRGVRDGSQSVRWFASPKVTLLCRCVHRAQTLRSYALPFPDYYFCTTYIHTHSHTAHVYISCLLFSPVRLHFFPDLLMPMYLLGGYGAALD